MMHLTFYPHSPRTCGLSKKLDLFMGYCRLFSLIFTVIGVLIMMLSFETERETRVNTLFSLLGSHCFTDSSKAILSLSLFKESSLRFSHRTHDCMQYAEKLHYPYSILVLSIFRWCQRCNQAKRNPKKKIFFWFINCGFVLSLFHFLA